MYYRPLFAVSIGFVIAISGSGCSKGFPKTQVKITLDGTPVAGATVNLVPIDRDAPSGAEGLTDADGVCTLSAPNKPGVPPGAYKVVVTKAEKLEGMDADSPTKNMQKHFEAHGGGRNQKPPSGGNGGIPAKYTSKDSTDLKLEVPTKESVVEIKLSSK